MDRHLARDLEQSRDRIEAAEKKEIIPEIHQESLDYKD